MSEEFVREWTIPVGEGWIRINMSAPKDSAEHTGENLRQTCMALQNIAKVITRERIKIQKARGTK